MKIIKATPADKAKLFPLVLKSQFFQKQELEQLDIPDKTEFARREEENFDKWIQEKDMAYLMALDGDEIVGYTLCVLNKVAYNEVSLGDLYVIPESRRTGVASLLVEEAIRWAESKDVPEIVLAVHKRNDVAQKIYTKAGFQEKPDEYILMSKRLK